LLKSPNSLSGFDFLRGAISGFLIKYPEGGYKIVSNGEVRKEGNDWIVTKPIEVKPVIEQKKEEPAKSQYPKGFNTQKQKDFFDAMSKER